MNTQQFNQEPFNDPAVEPSSIELKVILFDGDEAVLGELDPDICEQIIETDALQAESTIDLTYPLNDAGYDLLKSAFSLAIPDRDTGWNVYDIIRMEEDIVEGVVQVYGENRFYELLTEPILTESFSGATAEEAINTILNGTRWIFRNLSVSGSSTWSIIDTNPLKALRYCESEYDGYLKFSASVGDFGIEEFYVDFLERLGSETGLEFDLSHNMKKIMITTNKANLVTALYGRGPTQNSDPESESEEKLTFTDVLWDTGAGSPANKPVGQDWVGDEAARLLYGKPDGAGGRRHIFGVFESQSTTAASLLQNTWEVLQRNNTPKVNVEAKVVDLQRVAGFEHEKVRNGDTVRVKVPEFGHYLDTEVIKVQPDRKSPINTVIEFGDFRKSTMDSSDELTEKVNSLYSRKAIFERAGLIEKGIVDTEIVYSIDGVILGTDCKLTGSLDAATGTFSGSLIAADGTFIGTVSAAVIEGSTINGSTINSGDINLVGGETNYPFVITSDPEDVDQYRLTLSATRQMMFGADDTTVMTWISTFFDGTIMYLNHISNPDYKIDLNAALGQVTSYNFYARNNVSADSFTDRTPYYDGDAVMALKNIKADEKGQLDHASLPDFARKAVTKYKNVDKFVVTEDKKTGKKVTGIVKELVEDGTEDGRDLGAMISILTKAVQELSDRIEALEK